MASGSMASLPGHTVTAGKSSSSTGLVRDSVVVRSGLRFQSRLFALKRIKVAKAPDKSRPAYILIKVNFCTISYFSHLPIVSSRPTSPALRGTPPPGWRRGCKSSPVPLPRKASFLGSSFASNAYLPSLAYHVCTLKLCRQNSITSNFCCAQQATNMGFSHIGSQMSVRLPWRPQYICTTRRKTVCSKYETAYTGIDKNMGLPTPGL